MRQHGNLTIGAFSRRRKKRSCRICPQFILNLFFFRLFWIWHHDLNPAAVCTLMDPMFKTATADNFYRLSSLPSNSINFTNLKLKSCNLWRRSSCQYCPRQSGAFSTSCLAIRRGGSNERPLKEACFTLNFLWIIFFVWKHTIFFFTSNPNNQICCFTARCSLNIYLASQVSRTLQF